MKSIKLVFLYVLFSIFASFCAVNQKTDLLVAVLMIKNEAPVICQTFEPLIEAGIRSFFIFDTGSTDDTITVVKNFFENHRDCAYGLESEPFVDFATSRNRALDLAEDYFKQGTFMLMLDAEWHLVNGNRLLDFCAVQAEKSDPVYLIRILSSIDFYTSRLIRMRTGARFAGVVHECIAASAKVPADIYFELKTTHYGKEKSKARWIRDKQLLKKEWKKNPQDSRSTFYLAQTCECLDQPQEALEWYLKRLELAGWDEENFITRYRIAQLYERLSIAQNNPTLWHHAEHFYLDSYAYRPVRAEPLVRLAIAYRLQEKFQLAYLFALRAALMPYPTNDTLFVEKELYDYERYDILGIVAWYCKEYAIGMWAVQKALELYPDRPHLLFNLSLYEKEYYKTRSS